MDLYTLTNRNGLVAKITNFGGHLTELHVPDQDPHDDVLAHPGICPSCIGVGCRVRDAFSLAAVTTALRLPLLHPS